MTRLFNITQPAVALILQSAELRLRFVLLPTSKSTHVASEYKQLYAQLDNVQRLGALHDLYIMNRTVYLTGNYQT